MDDRNLNLSLSGLWTSLSAPVLAFATGCGIVATGAGRWVYW